MKLVIPKRQKHIWILAAFVAILSVGLFLRDVNGVYVNKFVFLAIAAVPIFLLEIRAFLILTSILLPMFVGLPGNYISICLLLRLLYEHIWGKTKCNAVAFLVAILIALYLFVQNMIFEYLAIYNMMAILDFLTLLLFVCAVSHYKVTENVIIGYLVGVVITGGIMLITTLQHLDLQELMNTGTRLGDTGMLYDVSESEMVMTIDPNFYGMNAIAAISAAVHCLLTKNSSKGKRVTIISMCVAVAVFALIGLSRAFVLGLILWGICLALTLGNVKKFIPTILLLIIFAVVFANVFPDVVESILARFEGDDMVGGNGRINLIIKYYIPWQENILTILFGIGLYNCHTHCAPLLYLFGFGVVGTLLVLFWFICIARITGGDKKKKKFIQWIPLIVTFFLYSSIPAAGAINYTYSMVIAVMTLGISVTGRKSE